MNFSHISTRLYLSFSLLSIMVIAASVYTIDTFNDLKAKNEIFIKKDFALYKHLERSNVGIIQVQQWLTDISATRALDGLNDGFDQAKHHADLVRASINEMQKLDRSNRDKYQNLLTLFEDYYQSGQVMAKAYIEKGAKGGNQFMGNFDKASEALQNQLEPIKQTISNQLYDDLSNESDQLINVTYTILITSFLIVLVLLISWWILHTMFLRINMIHHAMLDIADKESHFDSRISLSGKDEISEIAQAFNQFVERLFYVVESVVSISENLSISSQRVQDQTVQTSELISSKASEVNELATTISHFSKQAQEVRDHIDSTTLQIQAVEERSISGHKVIDTSITQMQELVNQVTLVNSIVSELNQHSNSVGEVVTIIANIAEQTNLLALNAAIEAARAGEHGRGFAVVADEVRNLSRNTTHATTEIKNLIDTIQLSSQNAVSKVEESFKVANDTLEKSRNAGDSFKAISESVGDISQHTSDIAALLCQQTQSSESIKKSIELINLEVQKLSDSTKQSVSENGDLSQYSVLLKSIVSGLLGKDKSDVDDENLLF
ncbi:MAG: methyl-accepting chemotaxis protein [Pseudomonadota bacterium]